MSITPCDCCKGDHGNLKCSQCRCFFYCSQACQKKHWKDHKKLCGLIAQDAAKAKQKLLKVAQYRDTVINSLNRNCSTGECVNKVGNQLLALPCGHVFCKNCSTEHQKRQLFSFACPFCKRVVPENLCSYVCGIVTLFLGMAYRKPEECRQYCSLARNALNILEFQPLPVLSLRAELLYLEGKHEKAISAALALIPLQFLPSDTENLRTIIKSYIALENYPAAMEYIEKMIVLAQDPHVRDVNHDENYAYHKASVCLYHMGQYEDSIVFAQYALDCNRHFENVHKWIALSQKALGQWDKAVLTMRRAVRYEEPGHEEHTQRCQELLDQLLREMPQQKQGQGQRCGDQKQPDKK